MTGCVSPHTPQGVCGGHIEGNAPGAVNTPEEMLRTAENIRDIRGGSILQLPVGFTAEAEALGAQAVQGAGCVYTAYSCGSLNQLRNLPRLETQEPVARVIDCIRMAAGHVMLAVQSPYSVLAAVTEPPLLLRWLIAEPFEVKSALERITEGLGEYIKAAVASGADIVSLADPYALPEVLGNARYMEFVAAYMTRLLRMLVNSLERGVVHICPRSSLVLERLGCLVSRKAVCPPGRYEDQLLRLSRDNSVWFVGHRCIHLETSAYIDLLEVL
jgi:Uroporphyrinogen-III decarboxylase